MYDLKSKLSSTGEVLEVLGNNTYLIDCGNGPQHISGDVVSRISDVSRCQNGSQNGLNPNRQTVEVDDGGEEDILVVQDDVVSISTDSTEEDVTHDVTQDDVIPIVPVPRCVRRYRRNAEMLGPLCGQRLRIRR